MFFSIKNSFAFILALIFSSTIRLNAKIKAGNMIL